MLRLNPPHDPITFFQLPRHLHPVRRTNHRHQHTRIAPVKTIRESLHPQHPQPQVMTQIFRLTQKRQQIRHHRSDATQLFSRRLIQRLRQAQRMLQDRPGMAVYQVKLFNSWFFHLAPPQAPPAHRPKDFPRQHHAGTPTPQLPGLITSIEPLAPPINSSRLMTYWRMGRAIIVSYSLVPINKLTN